MDLTPGVRGRFDVDLDGQLDELLDVANDRAEQVIPFLAVDPNRRTGRGGRKGEPIDLSQICWCRGLPATRRSPIGRDSSASSCIRRWATCLRIRG